MNGLFLAQVLALSVIQKIEHFFGQIFRLSHLARSWGALYSLLLFLRSAPRFFIDQQVADPLILRDLLGWLVPESSEIRTVGLPDGIVNYGRKVHRTLPIQGKLSLSSRHFNL